VWWWIGGAAVVLWLGGFFNRCVRLRHKARDAFAGIDVQLKRRWDLVPNLVKVVAAYAAHEKTTLEEVVRLRGDAEGAGRVPERERVEGDLTGALDRLLLLVERYPELKADRSFRRLHEDLVVVEDQLQYARRYYNAVVRDFNTRTQQVPGRLVAGLFGFRPLEYFQLEAAARATPTLEGLA